MTVTLTATPDPVNAGGQLHIEYCDPNEPAGEVNISIGNAGAPPTIHKIDLDGDGCGSLDFDVPTGWTAVIVNAPGATQVTVDVTP